ncbi:MAG: sugar ABC transporter permease [Clostridiales bacterium]|nr:sugar ABC transporter permease [Clostridiales bacterium]
MMLRSDGEGGLPTKPTSAIGRQEERWALLFVAPNLIGFALFKLVPIVAAFALSFAQWKLIGDMRFIGLLNYRMMLADSVFLLSLQNTLVFTAISVPLTLGVGIFLAVQLNHRIFLPKLHRTAYFLPYITTITAVASVWIWIFHPQGLVNALLRTVGATNPPVWLMDRNAVMIALSLIQAWRSLGYAMMIYTAGLQNIPSELYEAADMDGAGGTAKFIRITWPMLTPTTFFLLITSLISVFQSFDLIYAVTEGGPGTASHVLSYYIYKAGFKFFNIGYANAMSIVLFAIIMAITALQWHGQKNWVE